MRSGEGYDEVIIPATRLAYLEEVERLAREYMRAVEAWTPHESSAEEMMDRRRDLFAKLREGE